MAAYYRTGLAKASFISGFLSLFLGPITAIPGIIIGHMARSRVADFPHQYGGAKMALTGLLLNYFSLIAFILFLFAAYSLQANGQLEGLLNLMDPSESLSKLSNELFSKFSSKE